MTLAAVPAYVSYSASASQTVFAVPFRVFASADLEVALNGIATTAWTLSGVGNPTCTLTLLAGVADGTLVDIRRVTARQQLIDYRPNDPFGAESHEAALDRLCAMIQDLLEELSRRPALAVAGSTLLRNLTLPAPGAGKVFGWNGLGTALMLYDQAVPQLVTGRLFGTSTATVPAVDGAAVLVAPALLPAGARISTVVYRCTVPFGTSHGLTSVHVGEGTMEDRWGNALGIALGTTTGYGYGLGGLFDARTATDAWVSAVGGTFDASGACTLTAYWEMPLLV